MIYFEGQAVSFRERPLAFLDSVVILDGSPFDMDGLSVTIPPAAKATGIAFGAVCHVVVTDHYVIM